MKETHASKYGRNPTEEQERTLDRYIHVFSLLTEADGLKREAVNLLL